jgi:hypothetical protein
MGYLVNSRLCVVNHGLIARSVVSLTLIYPLIAYERVTCTVAGLPNVMQLDAGRRSAADDIPQDGVVAAQIVG